MFPYTYSLKDYLRIYNFKTILNKKKEKMKKIWYEIFPNDDNIISSRGARYWYLDAKFKHPDRFTEIIILMIID